MDWLPALRRVQQRCYQNITAGSDEPMNEEVLKDYLEDALAERNQWRNIADNLYDALTLMKKRRGIDIDDVEQVFTALDNYEKVRP
jgi:hypothetical protein